MATAIYMEDWTLEEIRRQADILSILEDELKRWTPNHYKSPYQRYRERDYTTILAERQQVANCLKQLTGQLDLGGEIPV